MRSTVFLSLCCLAAVGARDQALESTSDVSQAIRGRSEALLAGLDAGAAGERLRARSAIPLFYGARLFEPAWTDEPRLDGVGELLQSIVEAEGHGLLRKHYHYAVIEELADRVARGEASAADSADLDLLSTDAFLTLGSHLLSGRINPETVDPEWLANRRSAQMHLILAEALDDGEIRGALFALAPSQPRYATLLGALADARAASAAGGWTRVPPGSTLERGSDGPRVALLTARLSELPDGPDLRGVDVFDEAVEAAVRTFQEMHGLDADGRVGPATLRALNVSAEDRAAQLEANLERFRWLPADLGRRHIEVNIAGFDVRVVEDGRVARTHRAVVGRLYRETPMFSGSMTYLVLSPYWHVPPTIAAVDKFPVFQADPSAVARQGMTILRQSDNTEVDPADVEWAALDGRTFNRTYRLRQDPGPTNALGAVKFMFPNRHNVYLHDTPSRELFGRTVRNFSSGCIRVEDPLGLAEYLLQDREGWDRARIDEAASAEAETSVRLGAPVPVHLLYWTAWADADGRLHYRDDVYGRDAPLLAAMAQGPPES